VSPDGKSVKQPYVEECRTADFQYWIIALCVYKGMELFLGAYTAAQIRNVQVKAVNDSHYTGLSLYNVTLISLFVVPLSFALGDKPDAQFAFTAIGVWFMATAVALLMFVPKIRAIRNGEEALWTGTGAGSRKSQVGESRKSAKMKVSEGKSQQSEMADITEDKHEQIRHLLKKIPDVDMDAIIDQLQHFVPREDKGGSKKQTSSGDKANNKSLQSQGSMASVHDSDAVPPATTTAAASAPAADSSTSQV